MNTIELQNTIIKKILNTNDSDILKYFNQILSKENQDFYKLTDFEMQVANESLMDYENSNIITNDEVFAKTKKWLEE